MTSSTTSRRTGTGEQGKRTRLDEAQREAADAAGPAKIAALHEQIREQVEQLTADPQWRAMLEAAAKFHTYSLNNQLLIALQAARLGISPTRVDRIWFSRLPLRLRQSCTGSSPRLKSFVQGRSTLTQAPVLAGGPSARTRWR